MTSGDWLPAQAPFDLVRRGYSPEQVTAHLERLEYDLRITTANRDATNQRLSELGGQLAATQAEADTLRAQLDRSALEPVSMSNLSDRMQRMIRLAEEEASEIRARSEADSDRLRGQLDKSLAEAAKARAAFDAERERTRKQLAEQVHGLIAEATSEAEETRSQAQEESARLLQEANAEAERTVAQARANSEQTLDEAHRAAQKELAEARAEAEETINQARAAAENLTGETAAKRDRLDAESLAHRTQVEEDFEIAITARRHDAHRVITERDEASVSTAHQLVADATAHAEQLVAAAAAESERLMQQATTYSNALVNRAAVESHQRVADADQAVLALQVLRDQVTGQLASLAGHLDHIRELAGSAPALIAPPADEQGRPVVAQFPVDPADRPTPVDLPVPKLGDQADGPMTADEDDAGSDSPGGAALNGRTSEVMPSTSAQVEANGTVNGIDHAEYSNDVADLAIDANPRPESHDAHRIRTRGRR